MKFIISKKYTEYFKSSKWLYIIWPYFLLILIHVLFTSQIQQPLLWPDEFMQLGHARYFSGGNHFLLLSGLPYSYPAYAFLILPAFWLFSTPDSIYQAVIVVNVIFASALYFPIYYILRNLFSIDKKTIAIISLTTCLYPAFVAQSMIAWQDSVIFTFYASTIALLLYFLKKKTYLSALLFSGSLGFSYMMHARVLPILIVSIIFLLLLGIYKKNLLEKLLLAITVIILFFIATKSLNAHIIDIAWQAKGHPYSFGEIFQRLITLEGLRLFLLRILGHLLYLIQATYGLFVLGLIFLLQNIWQNKKESLKKTLENDNVVVLIFLLLTSLGAFFAYALFNATTEIWRADQLIYGRYSEIFLAPLLALGLLSFYFNKNKSWYYLLITFLLFFSSFLLQNQLINFSIPPSPYHVLGIILWIFLSLNQLNILFASAMTLSMLLILKRLFAKKFIYGIFFMVFLFSAHLRAYYSMHRDLNENYLPANELLQDIKNLDADNLYYVMGYFCKEENTEF